MNKKQFFSGIFQKHNRLKRLVFIERMALKILDKEVDNFNLILGMMMGHHQNRWLYTVMNEETGEVKKIESMKEFLVGDTIQDENSF